MTNFPEQPDASRDQREHYFRQADRAWARALTWAIQCAAGRRALYDVLASRCAGEPDSGIWFHSSISVVADELSTLNNAQCQCLRADRRLADRLRITMDGISAVLEHLDEPIHEELMERVEKERARGHAWLHRLVIANLSLIDFWMAKHVRAHPQDREDIAQAARQGLVRASQRFDVERGFQFATCAFQWFRSYATPLRDSARSQVSTSRTDSRNLRRIHAILDTQGLSDATSRQAPWLAQQLDLPVDEIEQLLKLDQAEMSMDAIEYSSVPVAIATEDTEESVIALEQTKMCESVLATLDKATEKVMRMRFGLGCPRPFEAHEIARQLDVSVERVRQIYNAGLRALRENHQVQCMTMPVAASA